MKVTGIYGGSFNPIHDGHVRLAKALAESSLVDEMWLLVSPQNPFKANANLLDDETRLRLARLAVSDVPGVEVCDREFFLPRPSYMFNTLTALSREHPDRDDFLAMTPILRKKELMIEGKIGNAVVKVIDVRGTSRPIASLSIRVPASSCPMCPKASLLPTRRCSTSAAPPYAAASPTTPTMTAKDCLLPSGKK